MKPDKIYSFCVEFANRQKDNWPPHEERLAKEFAGHFQIPPFIHAVNIKKICETLEIEFVKEKLPSDLLGTNFTFDGKRRIAVNESPEHIGMKEHTVFHEIRELLEYEFREIGFPTVETDSEELELRADEFALNVICCGDQIWEQVTNSAFQLKSNWQVIGASALILSARFLFLLNASYCAHYTYRSNCGSSPYA